MTNYAAKKGSGPLLRVEVLCKECGSVCKRSIPTTNIYSCDACNVWTTGVIYREVGLWADPS